MPTPFDPQALLTQPLLASLATQSADGPRVTPVWFLSEGKAVWILGARDGSSTRRLQVDPRCAVDITRFEPDTGILLHLGLRGTATLHPMDPALFRRLLQKYLGRDQMTWNPWFIDQIARIDDLDGRLIRLIPSSTFTNNVSYFKTGPALAWP